MGRRLLILGLMVAILLAGCAMVTEKKVPTVTEKKVPAEIWIKVGQANIRSAATVESKIVITLRQGDQLKVIGESGNWYQVELPGKKEGWIHKSLITPTKP